MYVYLSLQHTHTQIFICEFYVVWARKELSRERGHQEILGHAKIILLDTVVQP